MGDLGVRRVPLVDRSHEVLHELSDWPSHQTGRPGSRYPSRYAHAFFAFLGPGLVSFRR
jgi:hypothetical protein